MRHRPAGGLPGRCICTQRKTVARVRVHSGGLCAVAQPGGRQGAALQSVRGVPRRELCKAVRDTANQAVARTAVRRRQLDLDDSPERAERSLYEPIARVELSHICRWAICACSGIRSIAAFAINQKKTDGQRMRRLAIRARHSRGNIKAAGIITPMQPAVRPPISATPRRGPRLRALWTVSPDNQEIHGPFIATGWSLRSSDLSSATVEACCGSSARLCSSAGSLS